MKASIFLEEVRNIGIHTIAGVPDSTLKQFCDAVCMDGGKEFDHYVTANEGAAVGLATGVYLAEKRPCLVSAKFRSREYHQSAGVDCQSGGIWDSHAVCCRMAR